MQIEIYRIRYREDHDVRVFAHLYDASGELVCTALLNDGESPHEALLRTFQCQLVGASVVDDSQVHAPGEGY